MAMEDPILFTGKELNFEIPKMTELNSAEQRLRDKVTKQEDLQTKYQDELRKNINVDTSALVSDFSRKEQYEAVKAFQDKWTKIAKEKANRLTSDDLMEMEKDKSGIANLQNEWKSSQALWEQDQALIKKSPGDFDVAKFVADTDAFLSSGQYKPNSLEYSGINMSDFFGGEKWAGSMSTTEDAIAGRDGFDTYTQRSVNATPEEAKRHILQVVLSDSTGRALKGIMKDFAEEDDAVKYKYLKDFGVDKDSNGKISDQEMSAANIKMSSRNILTNPILTYAQDRYLPDVLKEKVVTDKRRKPNPVLTGATVSESFVDEQGVRHNISQKNVPASQVPTGPKVDETPKIISEPTPWGVGDYTVPTLAPKSSIYSFNTEETAMGVSGKVYEDISKGPVRDFFKKNDTVSVVSFNSVDHRVRLRGVGASVIELTATQVNGLPEEQRKNILGLKVQTASGISTLGELISGVATPEKVAADKVDIGL